MYEDITAFSHHDTVAPFVVAMCGISYCDGTYRISRPKKSEIWCMEYIIKGEGYVHIDDISFTASAGDIYILPAGREQNYYSDSENPWKKIWFNIRGELVGKLIECYGLKNVYHIKGLNAYSLFAEFLELAKTSSSPDEAYTLCARCFLELIQSISRYINSGTEECRQNVARKLKEKLDSVLDYNVTFDDLTDGLYFTKSHIIRAFKEEYGITPYRYLLDKKLNVAKMMLSVSALSIKQISDFLGFDDYHYFSKFFKQRMNISPSVYRKNKRKQK